MIIYNERMEAFYMNSLGDSKPFFAENSLLVFLKQCP